MSAALPSALRTRTAAPGGSDQGMSNQEESGRPLETGRPEHAIVDRIQRLVDELGAALSLPVSVDDHNFRLQFYSPQLGMLDRVRIESILLRDSPEPAKRWVRSQGVAEARGPVLVPPSEDLGLLPRVCMPILHDRALLGYLWIIDAEGVLTEEGHRRAVASAQSIGPLMFRRLFLERLDRTAERSAMAQLVDDRPEIRVQGFDALQAARGGGILPARFAVIRTDRGPAAPLDAEALSVGLEVALEMARGSVSPNILHILREDGRAVVLLMHDAARQALAVRGTCARLLEWLGDRLGHDDIAVGVGCLAGSVDAIRRSFEEARDAAEIALRTSRGRMVVATRWLGPHRLLLDRTVNELLQIAHDTLGPVLEPRNRTLRETLEAFLDCGGDVASVAVRLNLHRSSVYARVQRLETLLDADLSDGRVRHALQHALVALRLADSGL